MGSLLTRDQFRTQVFARDKGRCVFCPKPAVDAHHILERRLWPDGGYYLANGASVCEEHHLACERTDISVEEVRKACGIDTVLLPPHLSAEDVYDKWGNPVLPNGQRLRGELFREEPVQKVLSGKLSLFTAWTKYPRTLHLPWSPGLSGDDKMIESLAKLEGQEVIATEKLDGENTSLYRGYLHARSVDGRHHPSRDWVRQFHASIQHEIPEGWRICGENLFAKHSIKYTGLPSYFLGFSIWDEYNRCLPWDETLEWFELLGITPVPTLYRGPFDQKALQGLTLRDGMEGYVVRLAEGFAFSAFRHCVTKFVRKNHVQTDQHWMHGPIEKNDLQK